MPPDLLVDTHCHLNHPDFARDLPDVLSRAREAGVRRVICPGYDLESSQSAVRLAARYPMISAAVGVHPHDAALFSHDAERAIRDLAVEHKCVVAIGETGLDYYRDLSPRDVQQDAYRRHIRLATDLGLPLIVHSRDAQQDVLEILSHEGLPPRGVVMHCLPGDGEFARAVVELGCYVGIAGPVTFRNAQQLQDIVRDLPLDRLLLETDAPYLAPHPYRGRRNEPSYLPLIAATVAQVLGLSASQVTTASTANARRIFGLELS